VKRSQRAGLDAIELDLAEAIGGARGLIDSGLASTFFVGVYVISGRQLVPAILAAVGVTVALLVLRLIRREPIRQAASGVFGVAVSAAVALATGSAKNFFVIGIVVQILWAVVSLVMLALRWPPLGVILGTINGEGMAWRDDPARRRAYTQASWIWVFVFVFRTVVKLPYYLNDQVVALGIVNILLGWPLFALGGFLSWLILRRVPPTPPAVPDETGETDETAEARETDDTGETDEAVAEAT